MQKSLSSLLKNSEDVFSRFQKNNSKSSLPVPDHTWIIGVSGGPDSMALSDLLYRIHPNLVLAHVNYHKRQSAERDEKIVERFARERNLLFEKLDAEKKDQNGNFQDWARKVRYDFYEELADKYDAPVLVLGHHLDDLLETYLIQKERKITPEFYGLKERYEKNGRIIWRPLLNFRKKELEQWCRLNGIEYGIDESNLSDAYLRNRIRHHVLANLDGTQQGKLLEEIKEKNRELNLLQSNYDDLLSTNWLQDERAWFVLGRIYQQTGLARPSKKALIDQIRILRESGTLRLDNNRQLSVRKNDDRDQILLIDEKEWNPVIFKSAEDLRSAKKVKSFFDLEVAEDGEKIDRISLQEKDFPVSLRPAKEGESISMRFGKKKLHRFFIDRQIPRALRRIWPVLVNSKDEVIWVYGLGADKDHFESGEIYFLNAPDLNGLLEQYDIMNFDF